MTTSTEKRDRDTIANIVRRRGLDFVTQAAQQANMKPKSKPGPRKRNDGTLSAIWVAVELERDRLGRKRGQFEAAFAKVAEDMAGQPFAISLGGVKTGYYKAVRLAKRDQVFREFMHGYRDKIALVRRLHPDGVLVPIPTD